MVGSSVCAGVDLRLWDLRAEGLGGGAAAYVGLGGGALRGRLERWSYRLPVYDSGPHVVCLEWNGEEAFITGSLDGLNCLLVSMIRRINRGRSSPNAVGKCVLRPF